MIVKPLLGGGYKGRKVARFVCGRPRWMTTRGELPGGFGSIPKRHGNLTKRKTDTTWLSASSK